MTNPIQYTSRTFNTILNDINSDSDLIDKPEWFKRIIAGIGDMLTMYINATANQSFLRTAFTRQAVIDLCQLIDYQLTPQSPSSGYIHFYLNPSTVVFPKTIALADLRALSEGSLAVSSKRFEGRSAATMTATSEGFTTDYVTDNRLDVARVYTTGELVRVSTTGTLPAPLQAATDYYAIYYSATEILLATTLVNAYAGTTITLTSNGSGTHTITLYSYKVLCYQQQSLDSAIIIGVSDGTTEWQEFNLPDKFILRDTLVLTINGDTWTRVDSLINSISTDKHFVLLYKADNASYIRFGDSTYGAIPGNFDIYANYAFGGGADSNISTINKVNAYAGSDSDVTGVSNPQEMTGGDDEENIESAKILAPLLLKARDRFVTVEDGEALAEAYPGVSISKVNPNVYGLLSAQVVIVPDGGGSPSAGLKTALDTYLTDRTILAAIDVRVVDPTYNAVSVTAAVNVSSGYTFAGIKPFVVLAFRLIFSEVTKEIYEDYITNGLESAVAMINAKWSTSFASADYAQIQVLLENIEPTYFSKDFQESEVLGIIQEYVYGVNYLTISSPTFPVTQADDEITQDAIISSNITEIP